MCNLIIFLHLCTFYHPYEFEPVYAYRKQLFPSPLIETELCDKPGRSLKERWSFLECWDIV